MKKLHLNYSTEQRDAQVLFLASHGYPHPHLESQVHDLIQFEFGNETTVEGVVKLKDGTFNAIIDGVLYNVIVE